MPLRLTIRPLAAEAPAADGAHELVFDRETVTLGRAATADVRLPEPAVSFVHARLERAGDDWFITDAGSTNGTRLNGTALAAGTRRLLRGGDRIDVPGFAIDVALGDAAPSSPEATAEIARRMVREVLVALGGAGDAAPVLEVVSGPQAGARLTLGEIGRTYVIGRAESCDLRLHDRDASREHACLRRDLAGVTIADLGAKNGVTVRGVRLVGGCLLGDGDEIVVGATQLRFGDPAEAYLRKLEALPDVRQASAAPAPAARPVTASPPRDPAAADDAPRDAAADTAPPDPAAAADAPSRPGAVPDAPNLPAAASTAPPDPAAAADAPLGAGATRASRLGTILVVLFAAVVALAASAALVLLLRAAR